MASEYIDCDLCSKPFNPRGQHSDIVGTKWICCAHNYTPEELAEILEIDDVDFIYQSLGLEKEES